MAAVVALLALGAVPSTLATTESYDTDPAQWHVGAWMGQCYNCEGMKTREVHCKRGDAYLAWEDCDAEDRPRDTTGCPCDVSQPMGPEMLPNTYTNGTRSNTTDPCPNLQYQWIAGDWTECSSSACGTSEDAGTQTRVLTCVEFVKNGTDAGEFKEAENEESCSAADKKPPTAHTCGPCSMQDAKMHIEIKEKPDYFWKVTEWTACPAGCGGMQTRSVTCVKGVSDGDDMRPIVSSSDEDDTGLELAMRGLRTVSATYTGYEEVSDEDCKVADEAPPAHEHQCGYCDTPDHLNEKCTDGKPPPKRPGTCEVDGCGDHGECIDAKCSCDTGYYGRACEVQGCMGDECECCASGVYDHAGACCDAMDSHMLPHLDKDGACCYKSALDACGVCGGDGVVVAKDGTCCSGDGVRLDGRGACCPVDKTIDKCGVCGGANDCGAYVHLTMAIMEPGADDYVEGGVHWNKTLEVLKKYSPESHRTGGDDAKIVIKSIKIVAESGASTYKAMVEIWIAGFVSDDSPKSVWEWAETMKTQGFTQNDEPIIGCTDATVKPKCGDHVCAPSEEPMHNSDNDDASCKADCPVHGFCTPEGDEKAVEYYKKHWKECMGRGTCDIAARACKCYEGYAGDQCHSCDVGYVMDSHGTCQPEYTECDPKPEMNTPAPAPAPAPAGNDTSAEAPMPVEGPMGNDTAGNDTATYLWWYGEWGNCTKPGYSPSQEVELATCAAHNGRQSRVALCKNSNNDTVADSKCGGAAAKALSSQMCNQQPCETFSWNLTAWSECSKPCGSGWRMRKASCVSSLGYPAARGMCQRNGRVEDALFDGECNPGACDAPYWTLGAWGACNATCGEFNVMQRDATCYTADGVVDGSGDACKDLPKAPLEAPCNRRPCESYIWLAQEWGACLNGTAPAVCGGERERDVACYNVDDLTRPVADGKCSKDGKPVASQGCRPCGFCEDYTLHNDCSGNGVCTAGACECDGNWGGLTCAVDTSTCASGNLDIEDTCCAVGAVISGAGYCCAAGDVLTKDGECCAGGIDGCGQCKVAGKPEGEVVDAYGTCCPVGGALDTQNRCCASGNIDSCGVCDGKDDQCSREVTMPNVEQPTQARRRLAQAEPAWVPGMEDELKGISVAALSMPEDLVTVDLSAADASATTADAVITLKPTAGVAGAENAVTSTGNVTGALFVGTMNADPPIKADPPSVEAIPVCEDGVCSPGEPRVKGQPDGDAVCMEDCPLMLGQCDAPGSLDLGDETLPCGGPGFGNCDLATLTCDCYKGYAGPACNWCDDGYVRNGDACEVQVRMLESPQTEAPAPAPGNNLNGTDSRGSSDRVDGDGGSSDDAGLIAGLTLMCVVIVAIAGGAFWAFKTGRIGGGGNNSDQYVADVNSADV